jgi:hypothetical protein
VITTQAPTPAAPHCSIVCRNLAARIDRQQLTGISVTNHIVHEAPAELRRILGGADNRD